MNFIEAEEEIVNYIKSLNPSDFGFLRTDDDRPDELIPYLRKMDIAIHAERVSPGAWEIILREFASDKKPDDDYSDYVLAMKDLISDLGRFTRYKRTQKAIDLLST